MSLLTAMNGAYNKALSTWMEEVSWQAAAMHQWRQTTPTHECCCL